MSLHRSAHLVTVFLFLHLCACADVETERAVSNAALEIGTHFVAHGSGEPVILVHGFSQTHEAWFQTPLYHDLIDDHEVIVVDLRGHGHSDKPHDPAAYGPNLQSDLVELLDHLAIDKAHFVGFSLGANVVGDLVVSSPDRVQTATMGSGFFTTWDESEEEFAELTEKRGASGQRYPWEPANQDYKALAAVIRGARNSSVSADQITAVRTPTLIVFGSVEVEQMTELQKQRLRDLPGSIKVVVIDGADHDSANAAILSAEFSRAVRDLIASNPLNRAQ